VRAALLSCEISHLWVPTLCIGGAGNICWCGGRVDARASANRTQRSRRTGRVLQTPCARTGRACFKPPGDGLLVRKGKPVRYKTFMRENKQSDESVLPTTNPNKARRCAAEGDEGRDSTKGNTSKSTRVRTQSRVALPAGLERVREKRHYPR